MMKRVFSMMLALLLLCTLVACGDKDDGLMDDAVINVGGEVLTYKAANGDVFTYDYLTSTTVVITAFTGPDEPHVVTIPAKIDDRDVVEIGAEAFKDYSNISEIKFEEGTLKRIGNHAFANCVALTKVTLPASAEVIGTGAFYNCTALAEVVLNDKLTTIENYPFKNCTALTTINFPASLRTIGEMAFGDCTALTTIELPEGVETIGKQAFIHCSGVETLKLPASITEIGDWAFSFVRDLSEDAITVVEGSVAEKHINDILNKIEAE